MIQSHVMCHQKGYLKVVIGPITTLGPRPREKNFLKLFMCSYKCGLRIKTLTLSSPNPNPNWMLSNLNAMLPNFPNTPYYEKLIQR